jgi:2-isopropylmalate synthase
MIMTSNYVQIFDTTLRDGEQMAGARLDPAQKLIIARQLERLGVDVIEAGFPCSSPDDFAAVAQIAAEVREPVICGLSRAVPADIDACGRALAAAQRSRIHTGIGVSDIHIGGKFQAARYGQTLAEKKECVLEMAVAAVSAARAYTDDVEFYAEDSGRAEPAYLFRMLEAVISAGATVVNIPDTTGYAVPDQYGALIAEIQRAVPNIGRAIVSVHCHNDLGMAVANSLAGVAAGARQVEGTILGIGERAGNAALEEVVMALRTRHDRYGVDTRIDASQLYRTSQVVAQAFGIDIPPNKAIIGGNAFSHSSGIHVDGVLKERTTYEIIAPEDVGVPRSRVVLTARTGRHGLRHRLESMGYSLAADELEAVYDRFLRVADRKQEVYDSDLDAIVHDEIRPAPVAYTLEYLHVSSGTGIIPTATVRLTVGTGAAEGSACGDGPVDAVYKAIAAATGVPARLVDYQIHAVTGGTEAMGQVTVHLAHSDVEVIGRGASTDIVEASGKAYIDGLNRITAARRRREQEAPAAVEYPAF